MTILQKNRERDRVKLKKTPVNELIFSINAITNTVCILFPINPDSVCGKSGNISKE